MVTLGNLNNIDAPVDVTSAYHRGYLNQEKINQIPLERQKAQDEQQKSSIEMEAKKLELANSKLDRSIQLISMATPENYNQVTAQAVQEFGPEVMQHIPPVYDKAALDSLRMQMLPMKEQIQLKLDEALNQAKITTEGAQAGSFNALSNQRNTAAGLNRANTQKVMAPPPMAPVSGTMPSPMQPVGKPPLGYRWKQDGTLEPIPGGPKDPKTPQAKAPTEGQSNAALYASRMDESDKIIRDLEDAGYKPTIGQDVVASAPFGNYMIGANTQKFQQAQRDFVNAVLRRESGAVISDQEFANAKQQYFPQPGDTKEVLEQKRRNRETAKQGIKNAAGAAFKGSSAPQVAADPLGIR
jgi:hypothetical protein